MLEYKDEASPLIADFLRFMSLQCNRSDATVNEYYLDLRIFFRFIKRDRGAVDPDMPFEEIPINDIDLEFVRNIKKTDINNYVDFLRSERSIHHAHGGDSNGIGPAATQRKIACLKSLYNYLCERAGLLDSNPTIGVYVPRNRQSLPVYLSENEVKRLLAAVAGLNEVRDYCIIRLFLSSGMRVSELVGSMLTPCASMTRERLISRCSVRAIKSGRYTLVEMSTTSPGRRRKSGKPACGRRIRAYRPLTTGLP